ncbi:MAG: hypothetical protein HY687_01710 [Chloroflexi bacterium]|nr:hypothetical protein [Chloroflexota bacterium]
MMKPLLYRLIALLVVGLLLVPARPARAAGGEDLALPPEVIASVPPADLIELIYDMSLWKSADLLAHLEAVEELLSPLVEDMRQVVGPQITLPDVTKPRKDFIAKLDAIKRSPTVAEAQRQANELSQSARNVNAIYQQWMAQFQPAITALQAKGTEVAAKVQAKVAGLIPQVEAQIRQELEGKVNSRVAEIKADISRKAQARAQAAVAAAGRNIDPMAIQRDVTDFVMAEVERQQAQLMAEIQQDVAAAEQRARQRMDAQIRQLIEAESGKLLKLKDGFENMDQRIEELARKKLANYDVYRQKAQQKKAEILQRAVEPQIAKAAAVIKAQAPFVAAAKAQGRQAPDLDALLAQLEADKQLLLSRLGKAESQQEIEEAVSFFQAGWEAKRKEMEGLKVQGAQELLQETGSRLQQAGVEAKLRSGLASASEGLAALERVQTRGPLSEKDKKRLAYLRALQGQLKEGLALIDEFKQAKPTDDLASLLNLVDRLQSKLEAIQRAASQESSFGGVGIFIEAENETATRLLKRTEDWHSVKEVKATWRPSPSGGADWYLSRGGEALIYDFEVPVDGDYFLWIRDLSANNHPAGEGSVRVVIDGAVLGIIPENSVRPPYPPGIFAWHQAGKVALKAGKHHMEVVKVATTSLAAILDAFYFTTNPEDKP